MMQSVDELARDLAQLHEEITDLAAALAQPLPVPTLRVTWGTMRACARYACVGGLAGVLCGAPVMWGMALLGGKPISVLLCSSISGILWTIGGAVLGAAMGVERTYP